MLLCKWRARRTLPGRHCAPPSVCAASLDMLCSASPGARAAARQPHVKPAQRKKDVVARARCAAAWRATAESRPPEGSRRAIVRVCTADTRSRASSGSAGMRAQCVARACSADAAAAGRQRAYPRRCARRQRVGSRGRPTHRPSRAAESLLLPCRRWPRSIFRRAPLALPRLRRALARARAGCAMPRAPCEQLRGAGEGCCAGTFGKGTFDSRGFAQRGAVGSHPTRPPRPPRPLRPPLWTLPPPASRRAARWLARAACWRRRRLPRCCSRRGWQKGRRPTRRLPAAPARCVPPRRSRQRCRRRRRRRRRSARCAQTRRSR
jgi:hypothetical protein